MPDAVAVLFRFRFRDRPGRGLSLYRLPTAHRRAVRRRCVLSGRGGDDRGNAEGIRSCCRKRRQGAQLFLSGVRLDDLLEGRQFAGDDRGCRRRDRDRISRRLSDRFSNDRNMPGWKSPAPSTFNKAARGRIRSERCVSNFAKASRRDELTPFPCGSAEGCNFGGPSAVSETRASGPIGTNVTKTRFADRS